MSKLTKILSWIIIAIILVSIVLIIYGGHKILGLVILLVSILSINLQLLWKKKYNGKELEIDEIIQLKELESALENKELTIYIQPIYNYKKQKIVGGETLVRWIKDNEIVPTQAYIEIAEKTGFIVELDSYVFEETCKRIKELKKDGIKTDIITVNMSRNTVNQEDTISKYESILKKYGVSKDEIEIEISEREMEADSNFNDNVNELSKHFSIAIDDFGTGSSAILLLSNKNIKTVKIAREFVINQTKSGKTLLENIIRMIDDADFPIIAEGIETKKQRDYIQEKGCLMGQGFYFAKPMNFDSFLELLKNQ